MGGNFGGKPLNEIPSVPHPAMPLTQTEIQHAKAAEKPRKLFDGDGLFLLVHPNGGKWWRFKYRFDRRSALPSLA